MGIDHGGQALSYVRSTLAVALAPIHYIVDIPSEVVAWSQDTMVTRAQLKQDNVLLREQLRVIESQLATMISLQAENAQLRRLLGSTRRDNVRRQVAEIIQVDSSPFVHQITINKGTIDGLYVGQPVVNEKGVVGQVLYTTPFTSTVLMITDVQHAIPVEVNRNGVRAIAYGSGQFDAIDIRHLPGTTDILPGDTLVTSGLGQRFVRGYPVAEVVSVTHEPGDQFSTVVAKPLASLNQIRHVLLLWPSHSDPLLKEESEQAAKQVDNVQGEGAGE